MLCNCYCTKTRIGQCYPRETLVALLRFCAARSIHLISDEIYALSTYERDDGLSERFTSVRAIDLAEIIDPRQVHVLYGMSKASDRDNVRFAMNVTCFVNSFIRIMLLLGCV